MRRCLAALLTLAATTQASVMKYELHPYDSVADPAAVVTLGNARFTVLVEGILRLEYSTTGVFEDRPTLAVVNRKTVVPPFTHSIDGDTVVIETQRAKLTYTKGGGGFETAVVLKIEAVNGQTFATWNFGDRSATDPGNLRGTVRTLDEHVNGTVNCNHYGPDAHCAWGLVSKSGWATIDETGAPCLDEKDWWTDDANKLLRNVDTTDLYVLTYSRDYMTALSDFTKIGGKIPIFPKANHGVWFTRWYDFANVDVRKVITEYEQHDLPMDILTLDMNWHKKDDWTGYSWDQNLFPYPEDTLEYLHAKDLKVSANIHDAHGIGRWEDQYDAACAALGVDPAHPGGEKGIPFNIVNASHSNVLEDVVMLPVEQGGMDFWWLDWQQSTFDGGAGQDPEHLRMNPTIWTAKTRVTNPTRRCIQNKYCTNKRGVAAARWGGLGQHRYQHGFSGDVLTLEWFNLAFQAYFTATAVNVGWGYWSHDIVGPGRNHEMYARWIQLGCLSGIMRSHDRGLSAGKFCTSWPTVTTSCDTVRPYNVPLAWLDINRAALHFRTKMIPYIYTHTAKAYSTGVGLIRPMYYHYPDEPMAYPSSMDKDLGQDPTTRQYMFGEDVLAAPVTGPAGCTSTKSVLDEPCGLRVQHVWVPPGGWVEQHSGRVFTGPAMVTRKFAAWEMPLYIKAGAVIPTIPLKVGNTIGKAGEQYTALELAIYPGRPSGHTSVYEDDGGTFDYLEGRNGWVNVMYTRSGSILTVVVNSTGSGYPTRPAERKITLRLVNEVPPVRVTRDGKQLPYSRWGGVRTWSYDGEEMSVIIEGGSGMISADTVFRVELRQGDVEGVKGVLSRAVYAKRSLDEERVTPGSTSVDLNGAPLLRLASSIDVFSYLAGKDYSQFSAHLERIHSLHSNATTELTRLPGLVSETCGFTLDTTPLTPDRSPSYPDGIKCDSEKCCKACSEDVHCNAWMHVTLTNDCFPLRKAGPPEHGTPGVVFGIPKRFTRVAYSLDLMQSV